MCHSEEEEGVAAVTHKQPPSAVATERPPDGKIQRRLWRAFLARPGALLSTTELLPLTHPRFRGSFQNKHRLALRRAARAVAEPVGRASTIGRPIVWRAKVCMACSQNGKAD